MIKESTDSAIGFSTGLNRCWTLWHNWVSKVSLQKSEPQFVRQESGIMLLMTTLILGVSVVHDSGATLLQNGNIVAAANEERFNRIKHYGEIPFESIKYCFDSRGVGPSDLDMIAIPSEIFETDHRLLLDSDVDTVDISYGSKSTFERLKRELIAALRRYTSRHAGIPDYAHNFDFPDAIDVGLVNHHEAHAATAYYCSGYDDALVVTLDGLGDALSGTVWHGSDGELTNLRQWNRKGSLGWFYGIVTQALGWWIGNGEGKTMGLASYSDAEPEIERELREILPQYEDGELVDGVDFNQSTYWEFQGTHHWSFEESEYVSDLIDRFSRERVAAAAQSLLEEQVLRIVEPWLDRLDTDYLATAGGVFLNVQINRRIHEKTDVNDYFIFPNAGDGGLPTGAALIAHRHLDSEFRPFDFPHPYLGPDISDGVPETFDDRLLAYTRPDDIIERCAELLADGKIVAWCQGRMEYGPRALGNRSILIDPTRDDSMDRVNQRVKFRDSWRPFAPSILEEAVDEYLVNPTYDPFMITSCEVREEKRDEIPAVTHVDGTTRPQVVRRDVNEPYWRLIDAFADLTGTPVVLNTSFNLSGKPIVCTGRDAIKTFYDSGLDALAVGDYILTKSGPEGA